MVNANATLRIGCCGVARLGVARPTGYGSDKSRQESALHP